MTAADPEDAAVLEVHDWTSTTSRVACAKAVASIWKSKISRYNFNDVLDE